MAEVAGVVLGAIPLILYALDHYQSTRETVHSFRNWREDLETFGNAIEFQRTALYTTLRNLDIEATEQITMDQVEVVLQVSHSTQCDLFMRHIRAMNKTLDDLARDLYPDAQGPPTWAHANSERMSWEWRRVKGSFRTKRREQALESLRRSNRDLSACGLERREVLPNTENRVVERLKKTFNAEMTIAIRKNAQGLHEAIETGLGCTCSHGHKGNFRLSWHKDKPLKATFFQLALSNQPAPHIQNAHSVMKWQMITANVEELTQPILAASDATIPLPSHVHRSASPPTPQSEKIRVKFLGLLPDKMYTRSRSSSTTIVSSLGSQASIASTPIPNQVLASKPVVVTLCKMLQMPQQDGRVECIPIPGSDPYKQIRIMYPESTADHTLADTKRAVRLHALLSREVDQSTNLKLALDRKQRFGIAAALAWAVLYLCDSPWLEEVLRDEDIHLFLEEENGMSSPHLSKHPYLSYDFQRSIAHPDPAPRMADPAAQFQSSQIQNITLYTLAIRLIELGLNKPFDRLRREYRAATSTNTLPQDAAATSPIEDFNVAKDQIEELMLDSSMSYAYAVDRCLSFLFPGPPARNTFEYGPFRKAFFEDVVAPIQAVFDLIPVSVSQLSF